MERFTLRLEDTEIAVDLVTRRHLNTLPPVAVRLRSGSFYCDEYLSPEQGEQLADALKGAAAAAREAVPA